MARALLSNNSVNKPQQQGNCVLSAVGAEKKHGDIGSLLPGKAAVNMHPQQLMTVFSVGSVQKSYFKNKRRYGSVLSSEFSVEDNYT
jgi:hypothetical protein